MSDLGKWMRPVYGCLQSYMKLRRMKTFPINQERLIYHCPLDPVKRRNLAMHALSPSMLGYVDPSRPHILHVGVTTRCNLRCPACPTGTAMLGRPGEDLDFSLYCRVVDELRQHLMFMLFWDWGEPLMHPRFPDMLAYAGKSGVKTVVSTNGTVANSSEKIERLVSAEPVTIIVCVDGADQQTYETYRRGGRLKTVLQTIRRLAETKERLGKMHPLIEFRSLATKATERQMADLLGLAQDTGADLFTVKTLRPYNYRGYSVDETLVPERASLSRYRYDQDKRQAGYRRDFISKGPLRCAKPLFAPTLNADGMLAFCSYAQNRNEFLGDLRKGSFKTVWESADSRQKRLRFLHAGGTRSCATCFFRNDHPPTVIFQVPLKELPADVEVEAPLSVESFLEATSEINSGRTEIT